MEKPYVNVRDYILVDENSNIIGSNIGMVKGLIGNNVDNSIKSEGHIKQIIYNNYEVKELEDFIVAVDNNELYLKYQPQYDINTLNMTGVEALLRWDNKGKPVSPKSFIKLAEDIGIIKHVGKQVINSACYQHKTWRDMGIQQIDTSLNLSVAQLKDYDIVKDIEDALDKYGVCPNEIVIEITETFPTENTPRYIDILNNIRSLGVKTSIDDFGMGYSSLKLLKEVQVDNIKIDRYFVKDVHKDSSIVRYIIELAKSYNLTTTAEGVETHEQIEILRELGCDKIQGYIFSPAVLPKEIYIMNGRK